jgi:hypothetical protein
MTTGIVNLHTRKLIQQFEQALSQLPEAVLGDSDELPLTHSFADGMYIREMFIPKGYIWVGKIHKYSHPIFLLRGEILVVTEFDGPVYQKAPSYMIALVGTKRTGLALSDTILITVHRTDETEVDKIELDIIATDYMQIDLRGI